MVTVRLFAGAAAAAGTDELELTGTTLGELRRNLVRRFGPEFGVVLSRCSVLVDGARRDGDVAALPDGALVDVLPPFAGG